MRRQIALFSLALLAAAPALAQQQPAEHDQHHPATVAQQQTPAAPAQPRAGGPGAMMGGPGGAAGGMMMGGGPGMMMGGPMMMGGGMMMGPMMMMAPEHIEGRLAFLRTELKINDAQTGAWNAYADALRANAREMASERGAMMRMMQQGNGVTAPQMLDEAEKHLTQHLAALRRTRAALEPLYAALGPEQKKTADQLLGHGMM